MFLVGDVYWAEAGDCFISLPEKFTGTVRWVSGTTIWYKDGLPHRDHDSPDGMGPALISPFCEDQYFYHGQRVYGDYNLVKKVLLRREKDGTD